MRHGARGAAPLLTRLLRRRPAPGAWAAIADPARVRAVLVLKAHDQLGDFLVATPAIAALRARFPSACLVLVTRAFLAPLAARNPDVDEVVVLPRVNGPGGLVTFANAVRRVAALRPDLAFVLNSVSRSKSVDAIAALSGAACVIGRSHVGHGAPPADAPADPFVAAGSGGHRDAVYDLDLDVAAGSGHQAERLLDLVRWTGASADAARLRLSVTDGEHMAGRARLEAAWGVARAQPPLDVAVGPRWIGIHPGAANPLKCWPLDRFVELGAALANRDPERRRLAIFDSPRERGRASAVHAGLLARGVDAAFVPPGPLDEFVMAAASLDLLVCNDSGVMHIAAALGVPTVSFHALGHPGEWAPRGRAVALHADRIGDIAVEPARHAAEGLLAG
jgi:ADP-heptose:LPS heptosyltransferase